ncbi:MAG: EAL domain-containing protein [Sphingomonadaceae bacterium]
MKQVSPMKNRRQRREIEPPLHGELRRALDDDEIALLFQPQVAFATDRIAGVEALVRWRHPEHGQLGAGTLFAVAPRAGSLVELSTHIHRKALAEAMSWPDALSHLTVAVNVTAADIAASGFAAHFLDIVEQSGLDPARLTLEVTEGGLIGDIAEAAAILSRLREAGLKIAIDDFGTGYSSLAYLKNLPLDCLKIDKHFSRDIAGNARDRAIVRGVIRIARDIGLAVVAEGVESEEQKRLLAEEGCDFYQGYLCSPPVDSRRLAELVRAQDD